MRRSSRWLWLAATAVCAATCAAFWTVALLDRTTLGGMSRAWAGTFLIFTVALAGWTWWPVRLLGACAAIGGLPAAALCTACLLAVYLSEDAHHAFVYAPAFKGLALPIMGMLCLGSPALAAAGAAASADGGSLAALLEELRRELTTHRRAIVAATLLSIGALHAASYCAIATDDSIRYWAVADGLAAGTGYPVTTGTAGGGGFYLVELPLYPLLLLPSFALLGHRFVALEAPLLLANLALPLVFYGLAREMRVGRLAALAMATALLSVPYYQSYALGAAQPEPLLAVELGAVLLLALRATRGDERALTWIALGLCAAAAVLTRPEGLLYVGSLAVALGWHLLRNGRRRRVGLIGCLAASLPVAAFSGFLWWKFGLLWPAGWTNVAGPQFIAQNVQLALRQDVPHYAAAAGLPVPSASGPLFVLVCAMAALVGCWKAIRWSPVLWCVPVAMALNLGVIFTSPSYLTPDLFSPGTFFRHISVAFPWLVPAVAALIANEEPRTKNRERQPHFSLFFTIGAAVFIVWELAVLGNTAAANQAGRPTALTSDPYLLLSDLRRADDRLPALPFTADGGVAAVRSDFDYLAMRTWLFNAVRPFDQHVNDAGRAYTLAASVIAVAALGALAAGRTRPAAG